MLFKKYSFGLHSDSYGFPPGVHPQSLHNPMIGPDSGKIDLSVQILSMTCMSLLMSVYELVDEPCMSLWMRRVAVSTPSD